MVDRLGGPRKFASHLDRFPESVYNKAEDSHLYRFLYSLLGPAGIGWLNKNYLDARLIIEEHGLELFDIERFYGDPLQFGRIVEELYDEDPSGMLDRATWEKIRAKDARFRSRALDFFAGAKAGGTPEGMRFISRSGLGHDVQIIENYKAMFDRHCDLPIGLEVYGQTNTTGEFIVLPRQEISQSEKQIIRVYGTITGGYWQLTFQDELSAALDYDATAGEVQEALEDMASIGPENVLVQGGPFPDPIEIIFQNELSNQDLPPLSTINGLTGSPPLPSTSDSPLISTTTVQGGIDSVDEIAYIPPRLWHNLQTAIDRIRPIGSIPTTGRLRGTFSRNSWQTVVASSEFTSVLRYVTGTKSVPWPSEFDNQAYWVETDVEKEAPRVKDDIQQHYVAFHNVAQVIASSSHSGPFNPGQIAVFPILDHVSNIYKADMALADYAEPLMVTANTWQSASNFSTVLINGIYPAEYMDLPGVPPIKYLDEQFWSSSERTTPTSETLIIDLGVAQAINYLVFEIIPKPFDLQIAYSVQHIDPEQDTFIDVTPDDLLPFETGFQCIAAENPWYPVEMSFTNSKGEMIFARSLKLTFTRQDFAQMHYLDFEGNEQTYGWSIDVRNLRIGRNVNR